jgi:phage tail-like protein
MDGITQPDFRMSGLDASTDSTDCREGDLNHARKLPVLNKFSPVTLKRGITDSDELWEWRATVIAGKAERKNGSISLDDTGQSSCAEFFNVAFKVDWPRRVPRAWQCRGCGRLSDTHEKNGRLDEGAPEVRR